MTAFEFAAVVVASAVGMSIKSITGVGYPLVAIPLLAPVIGVESAVVVVSVPNTAANALLVWRVRHAQEQTRDLPVLLAASVVGTVVGTFALVSWPEQPLLVTLVILIGAFVAVTLMSDRLTISPAAGRRFSGVAGLGAGLAQGAVGASGPVVIGWLYCYRLTRDAFILSVTSLFLLSGATQIAALAAAGAYTSDLLFAGALAFAPVAALIPVGERLRHRLSSKAFDRAVLAVLAVGACALLVRAFS